MKRPAADGERGASPDSKAEEFLRRFLQRHPRFFVHVGIGLGILTLIALVVAKFSGANQ